MRKIEFRGKRKDNNECVYGDLIYDENEAYIVSQIGYINNESLDFASNYMEVFTYEVIPETVGQYTGIKDDDKTKIYEGDIVLYTPLLVSNEEPFKGVVKFSEGAYWIDNGKDARPLFAEVDSLKVLGNSYKSKKGRIYNYERS